METVLINQLIWRGSYLVGAIFFLFIIKRLLAGKIVWMVIWVLILGSFIWMRFVEPYQLQVQEVNIDMGLDTTVAMIADIHLGVYKDQDYFSKVVEKINARDDVDMVLIGGDFVYNLTQKQSLAQLLQPLQSLERPVYAVLGNHDIGIPGDFDMRLPLIKVLEHYGVTVLQNDILRAGDFFLAGLGPYLGGEADTNILTRVDDDEDVIVLTHNPDAVTNFPNDSADLTLAGHTHCGQIRPPFIYNFLRPHIVPVEGDFDCGLTQEERTTLYITPGLGEVLLPIRLFNPPTISILHL